MSKIIIEASTSYVAENAVVSLLKGGLVAKTARISYNVTKGLPSVEEVDNYPLILEGFLGSFPVEVFVFSVTAGYGGTGPNAMVDILKSAGFIFDESDIFTKNLADSTGQINLNYKR